MESGNAVMNAAAPTPSALQWLSCGLLAGISRLLHQIDSGLYFLVPHRGRSSWVFQQSVLAFLPFAATLSKCVLRWLVASIFLNFLFLVQLGSCTSRYFRSFFFQAFNSGRINDLTYKGKHRSEVTSFHRFSRLYDPQANSTLWTWSFTFPSFWLIHY